MRGFVAAVVWVLLILAAAWFGLGRRLVAQANALRAELREMEARLARARQAKAEVERIQTELRELEAKLAQLRRQLPAEAELRSVFEGVVFRARGSGLDVTLWRPGRAAAQAEALPYRTWPVELEALGRYHAFVGMAKAVEAMERLVVLAGWTIETVEAGRPPRLRFRLRVETYTYAPPPPPPREKPTQREGPTQPADLLP